MRIPYTISLTVCKNLYNNMWDHDLSCERQHQCQCQDQCCWGYFFIFSIVIILIWNKISCIVMLESSIAQKSYYNKSKMTLLYVYLAPCCCLLVWHSMCTLCDQFWYSLLYFSWHNHPRDNTSLLDTYCSTAETVIPVVQLMNISDCPSVHSRIL